MAAYIMHIRVKRLLHGQSNIVFIDEVGAKVLELKRNHARCGLLGACAGGMRRRWKGEKEEPGPE